MKTFQIATFTLSASAMILFTGCDRAEEQTPTPPSAPCRSARRRDNPESPTPTTPATPDTSEIKETVDATVDAAKETAKEVTNEVQAQAQKTDEEAKTLVTESNWEKALEKVTSLGNMKLTPEQQKIVDDLKATIQKAIAGTIPPTMSPLEMPKNPSEICLNNFRASRTSLMRPLGLPEKWVHHV